MTLFKKLRFTFLSFTVSTTALLAQTHQIKGTLGQQKNKAIQLVGYTALHDTLIAHTVTDSLGRFELSYPKKYVGAALLQIKEVSAVIVLLQDENFDIEWSDISNFNSLKFLNSKTNQTFSEGYQLYQESQKKLVGINYLIDLYPLESEKISWLQKEKQEQELTYQRFVDQLSDRNYAKFYLNLRKTISNLTQKNKNDETTLIQIQKEFETYDFSNKQLQNSGILKDYIDQYFAILISKKVSEQEQIKDINYLLTKLNSNTALKQEVSRHLFNYYEKHNLQKQAEFIALAMLNQSNCKLESSSLQVYEQYRKLAIGNTAPDIKLENNKTLKQLSNKFKLVVFGASWCPNCQNDYPSLVGAYKRVKDKTDLEIIYIYQ